MWLFRKKSACILSFYTPVIIVQHFWVENKYDCEDKKQTKTSRFSPVWGAQVEEQKETAKQIDSHFSRVSS